MLCATLPSGGRTSGYSRANGNQGTAKPSRAAFTTRKLIFSHEAFCRDEVDRSGVDTILKGIVHKVGHASLRIDELGRSMKRVLSFS